MENGMGMHGVGFTRENDAVKVVVEGHHRTHRKEEEKKDGNSIFAGDMLSRQDAVSEKFALAQKSAIKRLLDQLDEDVKIDEGMADSKEKVELLSEGICENIEKLGELDKRREELKKEHEIAPDSQEQKDLELIQKANAAKDNPLDEELKLTPEEEERLKNMPPLTDYQEAMLLCDKEEKQYRDAMKDSRKEIAIENATVEATKKALLKVHPMVDAMKDADAIIKNARKEQVGELYKEGIDKIDEDIAENQKEIAENQEKALEEKIEREKMKEEDAKKEQSEQELQGTVLSATMQAVSYEQKISGNLQTNIKSLIQDQIVLDVDLKGLRVNKQV